MSLNTLPSEILIEIYASVSAVSDALNLSLVNRHLHDVWKTNASRLVEPILRQEMEYAEQALRLVSIQEVVRQPGTVYDVDCSEETLTKSQVYNKLRQLSANLKASRKADQVLRSWENNRPGFRHPLSYWYGLNNADFYTLQSFILAQPHLNISNQLKREINDIDYGYWRKMFWIMVFFLDPKFGGDERVRESLFNQFVPFPQMRFTLFVTIRRDDWLSAFGYLCSFHTSQR